MLYERAVAFDFLPSTLVPFHLLGATEVALLVFIYVTTSVIRGAFGFGGVAPAVLFGSLVTEPHHAILLALVNAGFTQAQIIPFGLKNGDWKVARPLFAAGFIAIVAGLLVFKSLESAALTIILGVAMAAIAIIDRYKLLDLLAEKINLRHLGVALGLSVISGLIAGISGGGGMYFYSVYVKAVTPTPTIMRGTSILVGSILLYWRFAAAALLGLISLRLMFEALLLVPPSLAGIWIGIRFFQRADAARFYGAFQLVLLSGAALLLAKGIARIF